MDEALRIGLWVQDKERGNVQERGDGLMAVVRGIDFSLTCKNRSITLFHYIEIDSIFQINVDRRKRCNLMGCQIVAKFDGGTQVGPLAAVS